MKKDKKKEATKKVEKKIGRPTDFSQELADLICEKIADGESLRNICDNEDMPNRSAVFRWLAKYEEFSNQYARAREEQIETKVDEINEIADDGTNDWMERKDADGKSLGWVLNGEAIQRSRLRIDAIKWQASKLKPKKYGDKLQLGGDPDGVPIKTESKNLSDDELNARILELAAKTGAGRVINNSRRKA